MRTSAELVATDPNQQNNHFGQNQVGTIVSIIGSFLGLAVGHSSMA